MAREETGLRNEDLRTALKEALAGRPARLEDLLARHGTTPSGRPNLNLAAAFANEVSTLPGELAPLLHRLASDDAAPNTARVFLPVAAVHAFVARIREGRELGVAWDAIAELAADERAPVRLGALDALVAFGARPGGADAIVEHAATWLEADDRELRYGAAALVLEVLSDARVMATLEQQDAMLEYLSRVMRDLEDAPRAANRSEGRRRLLLSLSSACAAVVIGMRSGDKGVAWLEGECAQVEHPHVREAISQAIQKLRSSSQAGSAVVERLRVAMEQTAKPLRHAALVRKGTGRGKGSRRQR